MSNAWYPRGTWMHMDNIVDVAGFVQSLKYVSRYLLQAMKTWEKKEENCLSLLCPASHWNALCFFHVLQLPTNTIKQPSTVIFTSDMTEVCSIHPEPSLCTGRYWNDLIHPLLKLLHTQHVAEIHLLQQPCQLFNCRGTEYAARKCNPHAAIICSCQCFGVPGLLQVDSLWVHLKMSHICQNAIDLATWCKQQLDGSWGSWGTIFSDPNRSQLGALVLQDLCQGIEILYTGWVSFRSFMAGPWCRTRSFRRCGQAGGWWQTWNWCLKLS